MTRRLTAEQIEDAIRQTAGNISLAARGLGVTRAALYKRLHSSPQLQQVLIDTREELVDIAESALRRRVLDGDTTAIAYVLNNSPEAKRRGWGPRQEIVGADSPVRIIVRWSDEEAG